MRNGAVVGFHVDWNVGSELGTRVGSEVGASVGTIVGWRVVYAARSVGATVVYCVGPGDGSSVGRVVGKADGDPVGTGELSLRGITNSGGAAEALLGSNVGVIVGSLLGGSV